MNYFLGGIESPQNPNNWNIGTFQQPVAVPAQFLPTYNVPIYYQNGQPACGGHMAAKAQNILLNLNEALSPRFVYALCKLVDGLPNVEGTTMAAIFKVLKMYGVCKNEFFKNDISLSHSEYADWRKIPNEAYTDALSRRIANYAYGTDKSMYGIKQSVYQNKAVLILQKPWNPKYADGHFFVADGFDETRIREANSLGQPGGVDWITEDTVKNVVEVGIIIEPTSTFKHKFTVDLSYGQTSQEIAALQQALRLDGEFTYPKNTDYYGDITRQAVLAFQRKYSVASAAELTQLNGKRVGEKTRNKLNQLFNV